MLHYINQDNVRLNSYTVRFYKQKVPSDSGLWHFHAILTIDSVRLKIKSRLKSESIQLEWKLSFFYSANCSIFARCFFTITQKVTFLFT